MKSRTESQVAGNATRQAVPTGEKGAFRGGPINVRRRMAQVRATTVGSAVVPAGVVGHENYNIGFLLSGDGARRRQSYDYEKRCNNK